jgi:hypothetical protein
MKPRTLEEEIIQRLADTGLKGFDLKACFEHIQADPLMIDMARYWNKNTPDYWPSMVETVWTGARSSAQDWLVAQITK